MTEIKCAYCGTQVWVFPSHLESKRYCSRTCQTLGRKRPLKERFEEKFVKKGSDECWLWDAAKTARGYGRISVRPSSWMPAHRASWEIYRGPIPEGMHVLHHCDTPACVCPEHLFIGTHADNMADMAAKGRAGGKKGENNSNAKLTEVQVLEIRASTETPAKLGKKYGVTRENIYQIISRKRWAEI